MTINVWEFYLKKDCVEDFIKMNEHEWPGFFGRSPDHLGTFVRKEPDRPGVYTVVDGWTSKGAFHNFRRRNRRYFNFLDDQHKELYHQAKHLGFF